MFTCPDCATKTTFGMVRFYASCLARVKLFSHAACYCPHETNLFIGTQGDFRTLARWINDGVEAGTRKPTLKALANRVETAAPTAYNLRFKAKECRLLIEALERKKASGKKSPAASALLKKLSNFLCVYD